MGNHDPHRHQSPTSEQGKRRTEVGSWLDRMVPLEEELATIPEDASPAVLVTRICTHLAAAGFTLQRWQWKFEPRDDSKPPEEEGCDPDLGYVDVASGFAGAAATAIEALAQLFPIAPTAAESKDMTIGMIDERVAELVDDEDGFYASAGSDGWQRIALAVLTGAFHGLGELAGIEDDREEREPEGISASDDDDDDLDDENDDEYWTEGEIRVLARIADSIFECAVISVLAATWFIDPQRRFIESDEDEEDDEQGSEDSDDFDFAEVAAEYGMTFVDEPSRQLHLSDSPKDFWTPVSASSSDRGGRITLSMYDSAPRGTARLEVSARRPARPPRSA